MAVYLYFNGRNYPLNATKTLLLDILKTRCRLINQTFTWTDENKARFLEANNKLIQASQEANEKFLKTFNDINNKMNDPDSIVAEFEIQISVMQFIQYNKNNDRDGFYHILANLKVTCLQMRDIFVSSEISIDKSNNWNREYFNGEFDNDYIGYAIHALLDTHIWSFQDIIDIESIWTDVKAVY